MKDGIDPRYTRLPRWAQAEMESLHRRAKDAEKARDEARLATDPEGSSALLRPWDEIPVGLGKHARVRFVLGDDYEDYIDAHVVTDHRGRRILEVHGGAVLAVVPRAANSLFIEVGRR